MEIAAETLNLMHNIWKSDIYMDITKYCVHSDGGALRQRVPYKASK
jgi:hypothetical protein